MSPRRLFLLTVPALALVAACSKAPEDVTATYAAAGGRGTITVKAAANGDAKVEAGQQTLIQLSDPFSRGDDYLGTADLQVNYWLSLHPTFLASTKVFSIVGGHVLGVIAAHDRAMKLLPRRDQLTGQLPLLVVMVGFTIGGLYLLLTV